MRWQRWVLSREFAVYNRVRRWMLTVYRALLLIMGLGCLATYTAYVYGQFKLEYRHVCDMQDAGRIIGGKRFGKILGTVLLVGQILVLVFIMAAHLNVFATMMNVLTKHATCSIIFSVIGLVVSFLLGLPRKLHAISYLSIVCEWRPSSDEQHILTATSLHFHLHGSAHHHGRRRTKATRCRPH